MYLAEYLILNFIGALFSFLSLLDYINKLTGNYFYDQTVSQKRLRIVPPPFFTNTLPCTKFIFMSLKEQINTDIKNAMRAKEADKLAALRAVKAAIIVLETAEGSTGSLSEEEEVSLLSKLVKQRKDAAELYMGQDRKDLADPEVYQAGVISVYLPEQMSEEEVRNAVLAQIAKVGASGPSDMGKVMGPVMGQLKGKADGKMISTLVKEELNK